MRRNSVILNGLVAAAIVLTSACSSDGEDGSTDTTASEQSTTDPDATPEASGNEGDDDGSDANDGNDICSSTAELESVLGGPVDSGSGSGMSTAGSLEGSISYQYEGCDLELTEGGQGTVSIARITAAEVDGEPVEGSVFADLRDAAAAAFEEDGFELLAESGAEAYRDGHEVVFLADEAVVFVEVEVDGEESVDAALELMAALIDPPEPIPAEDLDCRALGALAPESFGEVTDVSVTGGGTIIDDLQFQRTGCGAEHANGHETTITVAEASLWDDWVAAKEASSFSAHFAELDVSGHAAFDDGEDLVIDDGDSPWVVSASGDDLEPDPAAVRLAVAELALAT